MNSGIIFTDLSLVPRWTKISAEFVPTRDPKQVGSHALNYLTNMGTWSSHWNNSHSSVEMSPATRRSGRDTKKSPRGRGYDPAMELDGDGFDESDSESDDEDSDSPASKRPRRYSADGDDSDDGNSGKAALDVFTNSIRA